MSDVPNQRRMPGGPTVLTTRVPAEQARGARQQALATVKPGAAAKATPPGLEFPALLHLQRAIDALRHYVVAEPEAIDKASGRKLIEQATALLKKDRSDPDSTKAMALRHV